MLSEMTYAQSVEWEKFNRTNPPVEEQILLQIAKIATIFANAFINKKNRKPWELKDFMIDFEEAQEQKPKTIKEKLFGMVGVYGDEKAKQKIKSKIDPDPGVIGTDGKKYKYAAEEFAPERKKLPKRLRNQDNGGQK